MLDLLTQNLIRPLVSPSLLKTETASLISNCRTKVEPMWLIFNYHFMTGEEKPLIPYADNFNTTTVSVNQLLQLTPNQYLILKFLKWVWIAHIFVSNRFFFFLILIFCVHTETTHEIQKEPCLAHHTAQSHLDAASMRCNCCHILSLSSPRGEGAYPKAGNGTLVQTLPIMSQHPSNTACHP